MSKNPNHKQASIADYIVYGIYRIIESILRLLPMEIVCALGVAMGQLGYFLMRKHRKIVHRNLRIAFGDQMSLPEINTLTLETFRKSGMNFIASIKAPAMSKKELFDRVEIIGVEHLHRASSPGNGCILMLAHMGNWELLTQLSQLIPEIEPLASLYRPIDNPLLDKLIKLRRQSRGAQLFSKRDSFTKPMTLLRSGGTLGVIADQQAGLKGLAVPLFGKTTSLTNLPSLLHRKTNAPILPISMASSGLGKWQVTCFPHIEAPEDEKRNTHLLTARCARMYERIMSQSPADVFWMHGYWKVRKDYPLRVDGKEAKNPPAVDHTGSNDLSRKPFRILAYIGDEDANTSPLTEQLEYLKNVRSDCHLTIAGLMPDHPNADHILTSYPNDPPHLLSNSILKLDQSMDTPFDCVIDLTETSSGEAILGNSDVTPIYAKHGKYQNRSTNDAIKINPSLSGMQFLSILKASHL